MPADGVKNILELEVNDRVEVVIDRFSNSSGHFITYPSDSDYDNSRDGIHVELSDTKTDAINSILDESSIIIKGEVKVTDTDGYVLARLSNNLITTFNLDRDESEKFQEVLQDIIGSESISIDLSSIQFPIYIEEGGGCNSTTQESESDSSTTQHIRVGVGKDGKTKSIREMEIDYSEPSDADINGRSLYYVDSRQADCYHTHKKCEGLRRKEGDIIRVVQQGDELPDQISDRRGCFLCA